MSSKKDFDSLKELLKNRLNAYQGKITEGKEAFDELNTQMKRSKKMIKDYQGQLDDLRVRIGQCDEIFNLPTKMEKISADINQFIKEPSELIPDFPDMAEGVGYFQGVKSNIQRIQSELSQTNLSDDFRRELESKVGEIELFRKKAKKTISSLNLLLDQLADAFSELGEQLEEVPDTLNDAVMELQEEVQELVDSLCSMGLETVEENLERAEDIHTSVGEIRDNITELFNTIGQMMESTNEGMQGAQTGLQLISDILLTIDEIMNEVQ